MARNREPVLKRAKALGIEPQYMGINKKSKRQLSRAEERRASTVFSSTRSRRLSSYMDFRRSSSEIYMLRLKRDLDRLVQTFL